MTDTTEYLTTVADWFVMKGGEVVYDFNADDSTDPDDDDCERPGWAMPVIHEIRLDDLHIFVGEKVESFNVDSGDFPVMIEGLIRAARSDEAREVSL